MKTRSVRSKRGGGGGFAAMLRALLRGERGAVFAEAVIMLPFFLILWGCILWTHSYYFTRVQLSSRTKGCSWYFANHACEGALPAGCDGVTATTGGPINPATAPSGALSSLASFMNSGPFGSIIQAVLGSDAQLRGSVALTRPTVLGGGSVNVSWNNTVMCGTKPQTPDEFFGDIFHHFVSSLH